jgi:hypothetical protein
MLLIHADHAGDHKADHVIPMAMTIGLERSEQLADLRLGEVLPNPVDVIWQPHAVPTCVGSSWRLDQ